MNLTRNRIEATNQSDEEVARIRANIQNSPFRMMVEYDLELAIIDARIALGSTSDPHEFRKQQGVIEGLKTAIGIINRKN